MKDKGGEKKQRQMEESNENGDQRWENEGEDVSR